MKVIKNIDLMHLEQQLSLEVYETSRAFLDKKWNYQNVSYLFSQIYIPIDGFAQLICNGKIFQLFPGNLLIVPAGVKYNCHCESHMEKLLIDFSLLYPNRIDAFWGANECIVLSADTAFIEEIKNIFKGPNLQASIKLKKIMYEIFDRLLTETTLTLSAPPKYSELSMAAVLYINNHLSAQLTIDEISSALFVSRLSLQRSFKASMEQPIGKYISDRIIAQAERYLLDHSLSIREISDRLGFCDQFYFSRKFTQIHGMTPSAFRKINQS